MAGYRINDQLSSKRLILYDTDSAAFGAGICPPANTVETLDPFFIRPDQHPVLALSWTFDVLDSDNFDVSLLTNPAWSPTSPLGTRGGLGIGNYEIPLAIGLSCRVADQNFVFLPLSFQMGSNVPVMYGWCFIRIRNNSLADAINGIQSNVMMIDA